MTDFADEPRAPDARFAERLISASADIHSQHFSNEPDEELRRILQESIRTADAENKQRQEELKYHNTVQKLMEEDRLRQEQINQERLRNNEERLKIEQKKMEKRNKDFQPVLQRLTYLSKSDKKILQLINLVNNLIKNNQYINIEYKNYFEESLRDRFSIIENYFCEDICYEYDYYSDE